MSETSDTKHPTAPDRTRRSISATVVAAGLAALAGTPSLAAQEPTAAREGGYATVRGAVFDSTKMEALSGARVAVLGTGALVESGSDGTFLLEDVPAGSWSIAFFHDRLQALGVSAPPTRVELADGDDVTVDLAVPSEATILTGWCMAEQTRPDVGAFAGVVQDSVTGVTMPGAFVRIYDDAAGNEKDNRKDKDKDKEDDLLREVRADAAGAFRICDVPAGHPLRAQASFGMNRGRTERITVPPRGAVVRNLEMLMTSGGTLAGRVIDHQAGGPMDGAVVSVLGTQSRTLTDADGRFVLVDVPPGRHLVVTEGLGYEQRTDSVTIFSQETVEIEVRLATEALELEGMVVTARSRFGESRVVRDAGRRRGDFIDRPRIEELLPRVSNAGDVLRYLNVPGLTISERDLPDPSCAANADTCPTQRGLCVEVSRRQGGGGACNQAAVFLNDVRVSSPEQVLLDLDPNTIERIEVLNPTDAQFQYGAVAGSGAVAIFTRSGR